MGHNWEVLSSCTVAVCCVLSLCTVGVLVTLTGCDEILGVSVWVWVWVWVQWQAKTAANTATVVFGPARLSCHRRVCQRLCRAVVTVVLAVFCLGEGVACSHALHKCTPVT